MSDRLLELAQKRAELSVKVTEADTALKSAEQGYEAVKKVLDEVNAELRQLVGVGSDTAPVAPPVANRPGRKPGKGKKRGPKPKDNSNAPTRGLKKIILDLLGRKGGMEVGDIAKEIGRMVEAGTYHSESENIANNVSQAIHKLKAMRLIRKDEENKQYQLVSA